MSTAFPPPGESRPDDADLSRTTDPVSGAGFAAAADSDATRSVVSDPETAPAPPEPPQSASVSEIEDDIEATRERLGETVDQLTDKLNPKNQARRVAEDAKAEARRRAEDAKLQARRKVEEARTQALGAVHNAQTQATTLGRQGVETVRSNPRPLAIGAGGLVAALVGILLGKRQLDKRRAAVLVRTRSTSLSRKRRAGR